MRISKKLVFFIILLLVINAALSFAFHVPSFTRVILHEVQNEKENFDIVVIGQSHGAYGYNPFVIEENTGMTTYNLSRRLVCTRDLYYMVKESNYKNNPKIIIYDLDNYYWTGYEKPNYYADGYIFPHINNPKNKIDYLFKYALKEDFRYNLQRYVLYGFGGLKEVPLNIKRKVSADYWNYDPKAALSEGDYAEYKGRGFFYANEIYADFGMKNFVPEVFEESKVKKETIEGYNNIVKYCKDNDIKLICVVPPLPPSRLKAEEFEKCHEYYEKLTNESGVEFWDYNYIKDEYLSFKDENFRDIDGHMLGTSADIYSRLVGDMVKNYCQGYDMECYFEHTMITK